MGDMALDDVALTPGACGAELSCSFEAGACGLAGSGQWHWQSGGTGITTGPMADHTTGTTTGTGGTGALGTLLPALPVWLQRSAHGPQPYGGCPRRPVPPRRARHGAITALGLLSLQDITWW